MSYEGKLTLIIKAILEARKVSDSPDLINLYITKVNGLDIFDVNEIWDILSKMEKEEKVIKIENYPSELNLRLATNLDDVLNNVQAYFSLKILDNFDPWSIYIDADNIGIKSKSAILNFDNRTGLLNIGSKTAKFRSHTFKSNLVELLLKNKANRKRVWSWDEIIEQIQGINNQEELIKNKKKFYPACEGLQTSIAQQTGTNDFLIFDSTTVHISSKYI